MIKNHDSAFIQKGIKLLILIGCFFLLTACSAPQSNQEPIHQDNMSTYEDNLTTLEAYIELQMNPSEVRWQRYAKGTNRTGGAIGPNDWELIAIVRYDGTDALNSIKATAERSPSSDLYVSNAFVKDWFPSEIAEQFVKDDLYPDLLRVSAQRYEPSQFAKHPLNNGYMFITDGYVFLFLYTV